MNIFSLVRKHNSNRFSQIPNTHSSFESVQVPDGYGIGYIIKEKHLHFAICSKHRQTTRYASTLEGVLREMAGILEPISNTKVHENNSICPKPTLLTDRNGSYGDLWGENSFSQSRPEAVQESPAEKRWSGEVAETLDTFLSEPFKMPLNDEATPAAATANATITAINDEMRKIESTRRQRRGSNDSMPIRPDRRSSVQTLSVGKTDLAELLKRESHEEEKGNVDDEEPEPLSSPIVASLNDGLENNAISTPIISPAPADRGRVKPIRRNSNDLMPIRPNRRTSVTIERAGMLEAMQLHEENEEATVTS